MKNDSERLLKVKDFIDGMGDLDFHEIASNYATEYGRAEPNDDDYLNAIRFVFDRHFAAASPTKSEEE